MQSINFATPIPIVWLLPENDSLSSIDMLVCHTIIPFPLLTYKKKDYNKIRL